MRASRSAQIGLAVLFVALAAPDLSADDGRTAIDLPPDVRVAFLEEMRTHMASLDGVIHLLSSGDIKGAGVFARAEMAIGRGKGFGRYMPPEFREIGFGFHRAADDFARIAERLPDKPDSAGWADLMGGLAAVTTHCNACHGAFRLK
ncbi:MAG: hypothetical protein HC900_01230 [Methylacidiphilales bacterium]|nr:hypothetical protein [Candidatus Methylacidiphilales bacterium]